VPHPWRYRKACPKTIMLRLLHVDPRVLLFGYCPAPSSNAATLVGSALVEFRHRVLAELPRAMRCTHLSNKLRFLADVPTLVDTISRLG